MKIEVVKIITMNDETQTEHHWFEVSSCAQVVDFIQYLAQASPSHEKMLNSALKAEMLFLNGVAANAETPLGHEDRLVIAPAILIDPKEMRRRVSSLQKTKKQ